MRTLCCLLPLTKPSREYRPTSAASLLRSMALDRMRLQSDLEQVETRRSFSRVQRSSFNQGASRTFWFLDRGITMRAPYRSTCTCSFAIQSHRSAFGMRVTHLFLIYTRPSSSKWNERGKSLGGSSMSQSTRIARRLAQCGLTPRWSGRVTDKVPSLCIGVRAAQLNR